MASFYKSEVGNKLGQNIFQFTVPPHPNEIMFEKTKSLVKWIICDLKPFSVVESESFMKLIYKLDPRYRLPSRHTITVKSRYTELSVQEQKFGI